MTNSQHVAYGLFLHRIRVAVALGEVRVSNYYVSTMPQERGEHVVHAEGCPRLQLMPFRVNLGDYPTCDDAVQKARILFPQVVGCEQCSANCGHSIDDARR